VTGASRGSQHLSNLKHEGYILFKLTDLIAVVIYCLCDIFSNENISVHSNKLYW
jgi:hypothetical protein